jgi:hypothetical protein
MKRLINPRGRVIQVEDGEVVNLLKRGFLHVPLDEEGMIYSQVHDKGAGYQEPYNPGKDTVKRALPRMGDTLEVENI